MAGECYHCSLLQHPACCVRARALVLSFLRRVQCRQRRKPECHDTNHSFVVVQPHLNRTSRRRRRHRVGRHHRASITAAPATTAEFTANINTNTFRHPSQATVHSLSPTTTPPPNRTHPTLNPSVEPASPQPIQVDDQGNVHSSITVSVTKVRRSAAQ